MFLALALMLSQSESDAGRCAVGDPATSWFTRVDYPVESIRDGEEGTVTYQLWVDAEGCTTRCEVKRSSGYPRLDDATCRTLLRNARFKPARDAAGQRIAASFVNSYRWLIPEPLRPGWTDPVPRTPYQTWIINSDYPKAALHAGVEGNVVFGLIVDSEGRVAACEIQQSSGSAVLDQTTCALITRRGRFHPGRDADGKAVTSRWRNWMRWDLP